MTENLLVQGGDVPQKLARDFIGRLPGERLPRVHDYAARFRAGNGTIQAGMRLLQGAGAVKFESRGHLGTFLRELNYMRLWEFTGMGSIACVMPLPNSPRFEGVATGLRAAFQAAAIPFGLGFAHGAAARMRAVVAGRVELALVSRLAADHAIAAGDPLLLAGSLGPGSYLGGHALLWAAAPARPPYPAGLRVGCDPDSLDQHLLTAAEFTGAPVAVVPVTYGHTHLLLREGRIDVAPYNADEIRPEWGLPQTGFQTEAGRDLFACGSEAVLVAHVQRPEVVRLLAGTIDLAAVPRLQADVMAGRLNPSF